ncbi:MAG: prepilin peptidase [Chloroflexota bacterium]
MIILWIAAGLLLGLALADMSNRLPRLAGYPAPTARWHRVLHGGAAGFSAVVVGLLWAVTGDDWALFGAQVGIYAFLALVALIDLRYRLVLNLMTYPAIGLAFVLQVTVGAGLLPALLGGGMAFAVFYGTALLQPDSLGGGDVKLATLIGVALGFPPMLWALIVGAGAGAVVAIGLIAARRSGTIAVSTMPYAPFLCLGAGVALVYNPFTFII